MARERIVRGRLMRNLRRLVQTLSLALFVWLLFHTELPRDRFDVVNEVPAPVDLYFNIDPLHLISTTLASHTVHVALLLGLITIGATLLLGRVFCGWICPLGALSQFAGWLSRRVGRLPNLARRMDSSPQQKWKYIILIVGLLAAVFSVNLFGFLDPLSLTFRSLALGIIPALEHGLTAAYSATPTFMGWAVDPVQRWSQDHLFAFEPVHFRQGALLGFLFIALLASAMIVPRMWCRWLCPLGALLGTCSRHQILRVHTDPNTCTECGLCHLTCEGAADPHLPGKWLAHECFMCWNCVPSCHRGGITIGFPRARDSKEPGLDLGRRRLLGAAALGVVAVPLLRASQNPARPHPRRIRPPGARPENAFLARCIKCGECMKVCPTNFLQEAGLEAGFEGLWTPIGDGRMGYCSYDCTLCAQVCPTGAIEELTLEIKQQTRIGLAHFDHDRCLPWAHDIECSVCEEHCPTPQKAILLDGGGGHGRGGGRGRGEGAGTVRRPRVDLDLCIGCAICMFVCPVVDQPAIYVTSIGESRSEENQILLRANTGNGNYPY